MVARAALRDAFERVGLDRIVSIVIVGNAASRRVMEKLGPRRQRQFESGVVQLVQYEMLKTEYHAATQIDV